MSGKFEPKTPVQLNPPKDDPISTEELAKADGALPYTLPLSTFKPISDCHGASARQNDSHNGNSDTDQQVPMERNAM